MPEVFIQSAIFIASLFVLIKASGYFTDAAERIGLAFGMPAFIVGVTIVALGTSLPELVSSVIAVVEGASEIVVGNVVGSNIANIFLVLGIAAIIGKKLEISYELIHVDLPILIGSTFLMAATIWDGVFNWQEGILCLAGFLVYLLYTVRSESQVEAGKGKKEKIVKKVKLGWKVWGMLFGSAAFIFLGAKYTIDSIIVLSEIMNIGKEIIAVSAVALGTSLPELMVTISAARRGNAEMAVGNVLGSNIFNSFVVMGIPAIVGTLIIPKEMLTFGLPMMIMATFMYFFTTQDKQITRWEGLILLLFYVFFVGKLFEWF